mgnify:CR=1 FL=1
MGHPFCGELPGPTAKKRGDGEIVPHGEYVMPVTLCSVISVSELPGISNMTHDISPVVSVPVLSEQITDVQPSVSTEGNLRTIAFFCAILRVPKWETRRP